MATRRLAVGAANKALHLIGPAPRFSETSRSLQPARKVNAVVRRLNARDGRVHDKAWRTISGHGETDTHSMRMVRSTSNATCASLVERQSTRLPSSWASSKTLMARAGRSRRQNTPNRRQEVTSQIRSLTWRTPTTAPDGEAHRLANAASAVSATGTQSSVSRRGWASQKSRRRKAARSMRSYGALRTKTYSR